MTMSKRKHQSSHPVRNDERGGKTLHISEPVSDSRNPSASGRISALEGENHFPRVNNLSCQPSNLPTKLKLQLFPIDEETKMVLQQKKHNPFLELIVSSGKKISSIVKHLEIKWGTSEFLKGELVLFPFSARPDNLSGLNRWTVKDSDATASGVYSILGFPSTFRLRYGWFSDMETEHTDSFEKSRPWQNDLPRENASGCLSLSTNDVERPRPLDTSVPQMENRNDAASLSWLDLISAASNISMGALLSASSPSRAPVPQRLVNLPQNSVTADSFDAAVASLISRRNDPDQTTKAPSTSILDAEDTCHAFNLAPWNVPTSPVKLD